MNSVVAKKSQIHGMGLFMQRNVLKGKLVARIKGSISTVDKRMLSTKEEAQMHPDWVGISMRYWIDPLIPFKYINHSCDPSCGIRGRVELHALRNLEAGDEVTIDYSTVEVNPHWQMKCDCGSKKCRNVIKSIEFLPIASFKRYYPFIPTVFKKFYLRTKNISDIG
ncbi:MAG TPA: SET domain-containing protein-lysine N-methyltransferase [Candidatus Nanoarchaeia archaeon]|nr:SET domain-containing protein-lysine N-methyltransferase [Candidatus Nanoarchaeia archaeon]